MSAITPIFAQIFFDFTLINGKNCCRNGKIVAIPSGELVFFGVGTGEYNELAGEPLLHPHRSIPHFISLFGLYLLE